MKLNPQIALKLSAVAGAMAVALGAFGAHGLKDLLVEQGRMETWQTAVFYHLTHVIVMLVLTVLQPWRQLAWVAMAGGVVVFSGSLYVLCLTGMTWLGAITPLGGLLLILGWLALLRR